MNPFIDVKMFHWIIKNINLLLMLKESQRIKKEIRIYPQGNMNACTKILWEKNLIGQFTISSLEEPGFRHGHGMESHVAPQASWIYQRASYSAII